MMTVKLSSCGNPDFGQYAPLSPTKLLTIATLKDATRVCLIYINAWNLGGGNWDGGQIYEGKKQIASISYNGRIWDMDNKEIKS
jgi:hypothetical protein